MFTSTICRHFDSQLPGVPTCQETKCCIYKHTISGNLEVIPIVVDDNATLNQPDQYDPLKLF